MGRIQQQTVIFNLTKVLAQNSLNRTEFPYKNLFGKINVRVGITGGFWTMENGSVQKHSFKC